MTDESIETTDSVADTLAVRGSAYGDFRHVSRIAMEMKKVLRYRRPSGKRSPGNPVPEEDEAMDMICTKLARIANSPRCAGPAKLYGYFRADLIDEWRDIAGYAQLAMQRLADDLAVQQEASEAAHEETDND